MNYTHYKLDSTTNACLWHVTDTLESWPEVEGVVTFAGEPVAMPCYLSDDETEMVWIGNPPGPGWIWDWATKTWIATLESATARANAVLALIDEAAGQARLRYITDVPGQAETYMRKEQQARAYAAAGFTGTVPSFIAAEAEALSVTAQAVAESVIETADYWVDIKGPQIEGTRRQYKEFVSAQIPALPDSATRSSTMLYIEGALTWALLELEGA